MISLMTEIDTQPLTKLVEAQPVSMKRVLLGTIGGLVVFVGGTILFLVVHLGALWVVICVATIISLLTYGLLKANSVRKKVITEFAKANNLSPIGNEVLTQLLPPSLQDVGSNRKFANGYLMQLDERSIYLFDYSYDMLAEKQSHKIFSLAVIKTEKSYPHIYLDAKQNNKGSHHKSLQKIVLEGDFHKYFDLYAERSMNIETLSFLTPDVMQKFIDTARLFDIETDGQNLAVITAGTSNYVKSNMDRLIGCLRALLSKIPTTS